MNSQRNVASFLLRFVQDMWQDPQGEPHIQWRGHINHIQGEEEANFTEFSEAVAFMQHHMMNLAKEAAKGSSELFQNKVMEENFKLWEKFALSYSDMILGAIENTTEASQVFQTQIDKAVHQALQGWQPPARPEEDPQVQSALKDLLKKLETLQEKISGLEKALEKK